MKHAALLELIGFRVDAVVCIPVGVHIEAARGELRQRRLKLQYVTEAACPFFKVGVGKDQVIHRKAGKSLLTQQALRDKTTRQNVALHTDG